MPRRKTSSPKRIYFDHASTTPTLSEVVQAMMPYFSANFHNPSALYKEGVDMKKVLDSARKDVANILHAQPDEIVFTGSGTEADNMAILGVVKVALVRGVKNPHVIISAIEHPAIMELQDEIKRLGGVVSVVPVLENGIIDMEYLKKSLRKNTVLVSIMYANNEIGTIQPIRDIAKVIRFYRKSLGQGMSKYPYFHTDASQAGNYLDLNILALNVDLMTLDGSKIYGPKGVGMLFVKRGLALTPLILGGGQERGLRSGTENVAGIVGLAKALSVVQHDRERESTRLTKLRATVIQKILKTIPGAILNGDDRERLPNNINFCVPTMDGEYAVLLLDKAGFAISTASSCKTLNENSRSHVVEALGRKECAESSLRITMGRGTTGGEIRKLLVILPKVVSSARLPESMDRSFS